MRKEARRPKATPKSEICTAMIIIMVILVILATPNSEIYLAAAKKEGETLQNIRMMLSTICCSQSPSLLLSLIMIIYNYHLSFLIDSSVFVNS